MIYIWINDWDVTGEEVHIVKVGYVQPLRIVEGAMDVTEEHRRR